MHTVIGLAGSTRERSYNAALLRAASELAPPELKVQIESIARIPLYNGDVENSEGVPEEVVSLRETIASSDGLLLVTPEYNNSIPGVFKNAIDWLSRPASEIGRVFGDKPVALMGATPGGGGTRMAQAAWLPVLRVLGTRPWFGKTLYVARAGEVFDAELKLIDEDLRARLSDLLAGFTSFVTANRP